MVYSIIFLNIKRPIISYPLLFFTNKEVLAKVIDLMMGSNGPFIFEVIYANQVEKKSCISLPLDMNFDERFFDEYNLTFID